VLNLEDLTATESTTIKRRKSTGALKPPDNVGLIGMSCRPSTWICTRGSCYSPMDHEVRVNLVGRLAGVVEPWLEKLGLSQKRSSLPVKTMRRSIGQDSEWLLAIFKKADSQSE
jgi:hypothetical protein